MSGMLIGKRINAWTKNIYLFSVESNVMMSVTEQRVNVQASVYFCVIVWMNSIIYIWS